MINSMLKTLFIGILSGSVYTALLTDTIHIQNDLSHLFAAIISGMICGVAFIALFQKTVKR